uniref:Uncharacterized protein n=1 Tax=Alexandrium andersonii TaxID=327968 RepID=A0A7S2JEF3_9DINO|mmetsp:Transcript_98187/g.220040  ORF Transcript_98187/g.220040 Transcript_98187/m.220040 type:complete len:143 (+) Transcript_98187:92-520(+)
MVGGRHGSSLSVFVLLAIAAIAATLFSRAFVGQPVVLRGPAALVLRRADGNAGGDFWPHPWAEELGKSPKGDDIEFEEVVDHFNALREAEGLEPLEPGSSPLVILQGVVSNSDLSGQPGMNKAQRIADGIQASSFLLSELTQ